MNRFSLNKYFSLVELLVLAAILAVLMSMLMPAMKNSLEYSKRLQCMNVQRQFASALTIYAEDADGWFVPVRGAAYWSTAWTTNISFRELLGLTDHSNLSIFDDTITCSTVEPDAAGSMMRPNIYGFNRTGHWFYGDKPTMFHRYKVSRPSQVIQMTEGTDWHLDSGFADYNTRWDVYGQYRLWQVAYRHQEGAMSLFFDGHVEYRVKEDMWFNGDQDKRRDLWYINADAAFGRN